MPTSEEVLAPPVPPSRPVVRAVVTLVVLGLVAWAVVAKLSDGEDRAPAAAPPSLPSPTAAADPRPLPPPPWVLERPDAVRLLRSPNPLEGRWIGASGLTLVVDSARLTLADVTHYRWLRYIRVEGHRLHVLPPSSPDELATYRWRIHGDQLTFRLLERTPRAALRLETLTFRRSPS